MENAQNLTLTESLKAINTGVCTVLDIVDACYDRIAQRESAVNAWQYVMSRESYLKQVQENQDFYQNSVLQGLPVAIKDIIDTADMPTELGSPIHAGRRPINDATCVQLLRNAGAIVMGKTVTTEFAYFKPGKTANPHNTAHTPGGSSSGSAVAVADNMVPVALGSQTAASVIRPAAYCGTLGYVATRGEMSLRGIQPLAQSLDSLGMFARCVDDLKLLRRILLSYTPDVTEIDVSRLKIVYVHGDAIGDCEYNMHHAMDATAERLSHMGATIIQGDFENRLRQLVDLHAQIMAFEVARNVVEEAQSPDMLSSQFQGLLSDGMAMSYTAYLHTLKQRDILDAWLTDTYGDVDAFLAPSASGTAPHGLGATGSPHMSRPWHVLGRPTVSFPVDKDTNNLPLSLQLIAHRHQDDKLLQILDKIYTKAYYV